MKGRFCCLLCIALLLLLTGCEHRPLVDLNNVHYVRVYIDESLRNVTFGFYNNALWHPTFERPKVMRVALCQPGTGQVVTDAYLQHTGSDEQGFYLDGYITAEPGQYELMIYNFSTESTVIAHEGSYPDATAYTNPVASYYYASMPGVRAIAQEEKLVYEPDHLFVSTRQGLTLPYLNRMDTVRQADGHWLRAESIVYSYYMQVRVRGIEYVNSSASLLTGLAGSKGVTSRTMHADDPVAIFFNMLSVEYDDEPQTRTEASEGHEAGEGRTAIIYSTFNTFGKLPAEYTHLQITFEFIKPDGSSQVETMDITPMFDTPQVKDQQWIILDREIVITPPPAMDDGGGFTPDVGEWEDINSEIPI